tara:strand:- start:738 stop:857 length:120 start_codon:yes stop_codon:yes gene_type:complete
MNTEMPENVHPTSSAIVEQVLESSKNPKIESKQYEYQLS